MTGAPLHCLAFTSGNPAVETVRGWLWVPQPHATSSSTSSIAASPSPSPEPPRPSPSSRSSSALSTPPFAALSSPLSHPLDHPEEDEKWHLVEPKRMPMPKPPAPSPRTLPLAALPLPSPSLTSLPPPPLPHPSPPSLVYVYDVPSHVTIPEFHDFISDSSPHIVHMQLVLPSVCAESGTYWVVLSFHSSEQAVEFVARYDRVVFNDIERDVCKVGLLHHVQFEDERYRFPFPQSTSLTGEELHVCPVCLDPIHPPSSPLLTILCLHHFHLHCLSLWSDSTCPVCRFSLHPALLSTCSSCGHSVASSLWMCLLCGHVGCSRYIGGHAYRHWQDSGHGYALSVSTQRVWDYCREEYVHRLVRNKGDGKLVELRAGRKRRSSRQHRGGRAEEAQEEGQREGEGEAEVGLMDEERSMSLKLEDLLIEYNYLLSSQLDQQRSYYQQQLSTLERETQQRQTTLSADLAHLSSQHLHLAQRLSTTQAQADSLLIDLHTLDTDHARLRCQWTQLTALNAALLRRQAEARAAAEVAEKEEEEEGERALRAKEAEVKELEEQLRDLEFFVRTQKKVGKSGLKGDIQQGTVYVTGNDTDATDEKKRGGSAGKKKKR